MDSDIPPFIHRSAYKMHPTAMMWMEYLKIFTALFDMLEEQVSKANAAGDPRKTNYSMGILKLVFAYLGFPTKGRQEQFALVRMGGYVGGGPGRAASFSDLAEYG